MAPRLGTEIFPTVDAGQFQLRLRAPTGTRIERTEVLTLRALETIEQIVGAGNVAISTAFIGVQPASYPINTIYLWTSGPQEAVLRVALKPGTALRGEALKEELRRRLAAALPNVRVSFEAGDIVSQVMSFGAPTAIEVALQGPNLGANRVFAEKVYKELARLPVLRDLQYAQAFDYPALNVTVDRDRAGQVGLTAAGVARSLVAATSSSRFIDPNYWRDPTSGNAFQIQVEIPQHRMSSIEDVRGVPVGGVRGRPVLLGEVAEVSTGKSFGLVERYNMQRVVSMTANLHGKSLGQAAAELRTALARAGEPPRGVTLAVRGQIPPLEETLKGLELGLLLAVGVIFLMLAANFQSFRLALAVLATVPATLCGVLLALWVTGTTLNVQSFMGGIMALGISVANSILLLSFAEASRAEGATPREAALEGARGRLRAILMTAAAMIAGMVPIALGSGEAGEQTAPLGRAVIGGLVVATFATLTILPAFYALLVRARAAYSASLDPDDRRSRYYDAG
jgi:multidrug efflux pump subunit AcrB